MLNDIQNRMFITNIALITRRVTRRFAAIELRDENKLTYHNMLCHVKRWWTVGRVQVDMINRSTFVDLTNYVQNGEWELTRVEVRRNVVYYPCCKEPFPDVTFIIHIRRRLIYYLYNVIFPCVMMSALTLLVFCLPPESGEKVTMGITVLLSFSVFLLRLGEDLPETSEFIPLLSESSTSGSSTYNPAGFPLQIEVTPLKEFIP